METGNQLVVYKELEDAIKKKEQELIQENNKVKRTFDALQKEKADVEELDESSISNMFSKLINTYDTKREKEEAEVKEAEEVFIYARKRQVEIRTELQDLVDKQKGCFPTKEAYYEALKEKLANMMEDTTVNNYRVSIIRSQESIQDHQQKQEVIRDALKIIDDIEGKMKVVSTASVVDIIGVPFVADGVKYFEVATVASLIKQLNQTLREGRSYHSIDENMTSTILLGAADVLADNIVVDSIAFANILKLKKRVDELENTLQDELKQHKEDTRFFMKKIEKESKELEDYIIHA